MMIIAVSNSGQMLAPTMPVPFAVQVASDLSRLWPIIPIIIVFVTLEYLMRRGKGHSPVQIESQGPVASIASLDGLKPDIAEIKQRLEQQSESLDKVLKTLNEYRNDSNSIYSQAIKASAESMSEVMELIKKQIKDAKDDFEKQLENLEHLVSEKASWLQVERTARSFLETPLPNGNSSALISTATTAREVAGAVAELEKKCRPANLAVPDLAVEIRTRLLRLEWLAQKYHEFRQNRALPTELELSLVNNGQQQLSRNFAKALEMSLPYWQTPKEYLETCLDEIVRRDVPELVKSCNAMEKSEMLDDVLLQILEAAHLQVVSPRTGDSYDPAEHIVVDFEHGDPGAIIRTKTWGVRYKEQLLSQAEVILGEQP